MGGWVLGGESWWGMVREGFINSDGCWDLILTFYVSFVLNKGRLVQNQGCIESMRALDMENETLHEVSTITFGLIHCGPGYGLCRTCNAS